MSFVEKMLARFDFLADVVVTTGDNGKGKKYTPVLKDNYWFYEYEYDRLNIEKLPYRIKNITSQTSFVMILDRAKVKLMTDNQREMELAHVVAKKVNDRINSLMDKIADNKKRRIILIKALEDRLMDMDKSDIDSMNELDKIKSEFKKRSDV